MLVLMAMPSLGQTRPSDMLTDRLIEAAERGDAATVGNLLKKGADVNGKDRYGRTALMAAASKGEVWVVMQLLEQGAQVNAKDNEGWTTLTKAVWRGYLPAGKENIAYTFYDFIDPWYVVAQTFYEGHATEFINRNTGATEYVDGDATFSPDNVRFVTVPYGGGDVETWKVSAEDITREWVCKECGKPKVRWSDSATIELSGRRTATLTLVGGSWKCSGSPSICKSGIEEKR